MNLRNLAIWGVILLGLVAVYAAISQTGGALMPGAAATSPNAAARPEPISYSQLVQAIDAKNIKSVMVRGDQVSGQFNDE